jgi:hypothetical protein
MSDETKSVTNPEDQVAVVSAILRLDYAHFRMLKRIFDVKPGMDENQVQYNVENKIRILDRLLYPDFVEAQFQLEKEM